MRKLSYRTRFTRADYFVVRHIDTFVSRALDKHIRSGTRVADIGCGEQPFRRQVEKLGGVYKGIDVEQNANGLVDLVSRAECVPLPGTSVDLVLCTEVLEHLDDIDLAVREIVRLLAEKGKVILTVPFIYPLHEEPTDYVRLTPHSIRQLAARNSLQILELQLLGNELESLAVLWGNLFQRMPAFSRVVVLRRFVLPTLVAPINLVMAATGWLFRRMLPCRAFLGVGCILQKAEE